MKRYFLLLASLFFMAISSMGGIVYYTQSRLFIGDLEEDILNKNVAIFRPFIIIPNRLLDGSEQLDFLRYFNFKGIFVKKETKKLEWEPEYRNEKSIFPRLVQTVKIEGNKFEIILIPLGKGVSLGFRIQISKIKSLPEEDENILPQLQAIYNVTSEGIILDAEINNFGYVFFICFPAGKKMYILSFCNTSGIRSSIRR